MEFLAKNHNIEIYKKFTIFSFSLINFKTRGKKKLKTKSTGQRWNYHLLEENHQNCDLSPVLHGTTLDPRRPQG